MFTWRGTFPEACALLMGYDGASSSPILDGFQGWLGARHQGRSQLAFWYHVLDEALLGGADLTELTTDEDHRASEVLFLLLEAYLTGVPAETFRLPD